MQKGLYEQIINKLIQSKLDGFDNETYYIKSIPIDKAEAANVLSRYLVKVIQYGLSLLEGDQSIEKQIELSNKIIRLIRDETNEKDFDEDIIEAKSKILRAILNKVDFGVSNLNRYLKEVTPYSGLSQSELFTGNNAGVSLESEIRKEILSSDKVCFLVSFIKWSGISIFQDELIEFTERGGKLQVITTSYMGATDYKAVKFLSELKNTEIKVSYNTNSERLHAKAYLFLRNTGFHTGYIGSSNMSRSALTNGLEWNLKITTKEIPHIIDKFRKTFDTYWQDRNFEYFDFNRDAVKLKDALKVGRGETTNTPTIFFDLNPYPFQEEILENLEVEREVHHRFRNLIVAATGTGKTIISAFDYKRFKAANPKANLLFLAHRKEILVQARETYQAVLKDYNFGELWVDGIEPDNYSYVFASIQTLNNRLDGKNLSKDFFQYIVVDEVHHISAASYRPILNYFEPKILLGLTATPERMDGQDILSDFSDTIAAEIRLPEALNRQLLCPFQYFGITDNVDISKVSWQNGRYEVAELTKLYTKNDLRVGHILRNLDKYLNDKTDVRALGFCVGQEHARYMAEKFVLAGLKANYLVSGNASQRDELRRQLREKEINYLFVVDIFNEGVDIPEIDTVLFLRPTESLTIFLQQLGRGLRLSDEKDSLTVLDFVGNSRPEYDFEGKFRALVGKTNTPISKEIEADFPHLPVGSSIVLEKIAKNYILENIKQATSFRINHLIAKIQNFKHQTDLPLTLKNFSSINHIPLELIYSKRYTWSRLCEMAGVKENFEGKYEKEIYSAIKNKWLSSSSSSYFKFILKLAQSNFRVKLDNLSENEQTMCLMLYYDVWQTAKRFSSLEESIHAIGTDPILVEEIIEVLELLLNRVDFAEREINLPYEQPLKVHARYTRDQILAAFGFSTFEKKSSNREGVAENKTLNTELLFIDLIKSEKDFSPTTQYDDYAISNTLFHWQTQNSARPDIGKGLSYIEHEQRGKRILLFVRENKKNQYKSTMSYVFLGEGSIQDYYGEKPMSIHWLLHEEIPPYLWHVSAKMAVG